HARDHLVDGFLICKVGFHSLGCRYSWSFLAENFKNLMLRICSPCTTLNIAYGKNHATNGFCIEILT
ncbi:hypothetical protein QT621_26205, partial [Xanthomonas citri pv. citri]